MTTSMHLLRPGQAAKYVGGYDRLKRLTGSGQLPFVQEPGGTMRLYRYDDLLDWQDKNRIAPEELPEGRHYTTAELKAVFAKYK